MYSGTITFVDDKEVTYVLSEFNDKQLKAVKQFFDKNCKEKYNNLSLCVISDKGEEDVCLDVSEADAAHEQAKDSDVSEAEQAEDSDVSMTADFVPKMVFMYTAHNKVLLILIIL